MWIDSLVIITCVYLYTIYSLNIYFIHILNQLVSITVKMADKIVVMTIKILSLNKNVEFHEKYTIDNVAAWRKNERLVVLRHYLHVPKHTHTHPNTDLNAHIWKYQYIYIFSDIQLYRETEETPIITTPYSLPKKQRAKKCYSKNRLWLLVTYTPYLFNKNNNGVILFFLFYTIVKDSITTARSSYWLTALIWITMAQSLPPGNKNDPPISFPPKKKKKNIFIYKCPIAPFDGKG